VSDLAIDIQGLRKQFGALVAVDGIDLQVPRGEVFALVGPDGAGKTTTMRMLAGILAPTAGTARVVDIDIRKPDRLRSRIGYMPQRFSLYGDLTVAENLRFFANIYHVPRAEYQQREQELLDFSRLGPFRDRLAQFLSGGMKQKLALACVLMHTPEVLFLDEPTTGVDPVSRREFWRILYTLVKRGVTLFVSTPYMDEAERCSRVAMMNHGRIVLCDTPRALKARLHGELLEVIAEPLNAARTCLQALPAVREVQVFGERLHVWLADGAGEGIADMLAAAGVTVESLRPIAPGLEDVFTGLIAGEEA
jgi:ABC-2 type transport system ATP-binding protein